MRWLRAALVTLAVVIAALYALVFWPMRDPHPTVRRGTGTLAIRGARIYTSPEAPAIAIGTVLVRDGVIAAVGADVAVPDGGRTIECERCIVTAGFWNAHVHFTERKWAGAPWAGAATLDAQLADMLTSRGFTTVVDVGSDPRVTLSLRRRIASGDLAGPTIYTAGPALYPPHGIPYYLRNSLPRYILWFMPTPATPAAAARVAERNFRTGTDVLKLFTGSYVERGHVLPMPDSIAAAAVAVAHRHHQLVFAHPSDLAGTNVAIESGVDVLAHAPDTPNGIDSALLQRVVDRHMAMIPTLKMFGTTVTTDSGYLRPIYAEVALFHTLGGQLLFGTDVGYMTDYRTDDEFRALAASGLGWRDMLRMLTTAPAERFGVADRVGTIAPGKDADLVVLDADPADSVPAFTRVRLTMHEGRVVYERP